MKTISMFHLIKLLVICTVCLALSTVCIATNNNIRIPQESKSQLPNKFLNYKIPSQNISGFFFLSNKNNSETNSVLKFINTIITPLNTSIAPANFGIDLITELFKTRNNKPTMDCCEIKEMGIWLGENITNQVISLELTNQKESAILLKKINDYLKIKSENFSKEAVSIKHEIISTKNIIYVMQGETEWIQSINNIIGNDELITTENSVLYDNRLLENFPKTLNKTPIAIGLHKIDLINEMTLNTINPLQVNIFRNSIFIIYAEHLLDQELSSEYTSHPISMIGVISITIPDFLFNLIFNPIAPSLNLIEKALPTTPNQKIWTSKYPLTSSQNIPIYFAMKNKNKIIKFTVSSNQEKSIELITE